VAQAAPALLGWTIIASKVSSILNLWREAFAHTFAAELRAERPERSAAIVDADPDRYQIFGELALSVMSAKRPANEEDARRWWRRKQLKGKLYSIPRLAKASFTFAGGADYIAWKINRHAGTKIELRPWQRRYPLLAAITLLPRLLSSGAVR